ncbi:MAG: ABC transporter, permease protein 2 (cluster 1, maltose/g3p/polyamine/iron) [uncultured Chloroflexia bacterium]|uniref:ABC transporter, permease protein 2 (Cluster 1, maltose/g3p/polyamine/iron) n=1 Tax=uncultured Chloroflexia bacterium TaxID=1672391 RepID=A0A6J4N4E1_9CHLR|nr:MAG: ABC transporter, permease protein 2 (cluster 1, maltose/g3p/polyamine/iron) [uncultured Chloroflexia bacterium]
MTETTQEVPRRPPSGSYPAEDARASATFGAQFASAWPYLAYAVLMALAFLTLVPIIWMVLTAFKSPSEVVTSPPTLIPTTWHPENFIDAWRAAPFGQYLANTVLIAGSVAILETVTSAFAAYAFARLRFPGRDFLFLVYLGTLMIPRQVTLIPQFILMRELGWVDTYQGLIIPQAFSAFGTFLLRQFFVGIPRELEDAARIDGASRFECFRRIILPLSGAALATLMVFAFLFQWNNLLWPLVMSNTDSTRPVAVGLRAFQGQYSTDWNLLMAAAALATIPVIVVYVAAQRWFVRGITLSGFGGR